MSEEQISAAQEYGADQIQILEGLEAVRKGLVCTLAVLHPRASIIWYMRL